MSAQWLGKGNFLSKNQAVRCIARIVHRMEALLNCVLLTSCNKLFVVGVFEPFVIPLFITVVAACFNACNSASNSFTRHSNGVLTVKT